LNVHTNYVRNTLGRFQRGRQKVARLVHLEANTFAALSQRPKKVVIVVN
jgi:hypothetical protein